MTVRKDILELFIEAHERYYPFTVLETVRKKPTRIGFNTRDRRAPKWAQAKGGKITGAANGRKKSPFSDDDVRAIRSSAEPLRVLAARYGVSMATVSRVRSRKRRAEVPDLPE